MPDTGEPDPAPPPPGWYEDPETPGRRRWWNGFEWADDSPAPTGGNPIGRHARNISIVGAGIWAVTVIIGTIGASSYDFNMQLWWVFPFLAVTALSTIAISFGAIGVGRAKLVGGRTPALIGLILGIVVLLSQYVPPIVVAFVV